MAGLFSPPTPPRQRPLTRHNAASFGAGYLRRLGTVTNLTSTPDDASLDITGDIDLRALILPDTWDSTGFTLRLIIAKRDSSSPADQSYELQISNTGGGSSVFRLSWKESGGTQRVAQDTANNADDYIGPKWVRATLDVDNGAGQYEVKFYTSSDPVDTDPSSVTWAQLGATVTGSTGVTSIFSSISPVELGSYNTGVEVYWPGNIYYAEVRNGIAGTIVANPDFRWRTDRTTNTTLTDSTGKLWTINSPGWWVLPLQGAEPKSVAGVLYTKTATFPTGSITSAAQLVGATFVKTPAFFAGAVSSTRNLVGALYAKTATFPTGSVTSVRDLAGALYAKTSTFGVGAITATRNLDGVLYIKPPTFGVGSVTATRNLGGVVYVKTSSFFGGVMSQLGGPQPLGGNLYTKAPTFPAGTVTPGSVVVAGVLFVKAPVFGAGAILAGAAAVVGILYVKTPTFFVGVLLVDESMVVHQPWGIGSPMGRHATRQPRPRHGTHVPYSRLAAARPRL